MRFYWPIQKLDHEQHMVWGYASTEAEDEQGEVIRRDALAAALEDYMRFANIRKMHQPSAVGIAEEAAIDDKGLYLARHAGDAVALGLRVRRDLARRDLFGDCRRADPRGLPEFVARRRRCDNQDDHRRRRQDLCA